ncbi:MAG: hypothetical protein R3362_08760, partial [Rhodothermales bacterium]|nr:hypothetical protein [Rhodothermales bacterium]
MPPVATPARLLLPLLICLVASAASGQRAEPVLDPATGEPVPGALTDAPMPAAEAEGARPGDGFQFIQHLAEGSTKSVRVLDTPGTVLVQNGAYLETYEVMPPGAPQRLDRVLLPAQPADIVVEAGLAYVALRKDEGFLILSVNNPTEIGVAGGVSGEDGLAIAVADDVVYLAAGPDGVFVYDIATPQSPMQIGFSDTAGSANGLALAGDVL